ncbi:cytochrome P450 94B3-like [Magnolia sinica]|uniref:cytochrome P450 94B3-like n=1 Tax=Magnolia sinica TaxID=86752 RepID=UPI002659C6AB|nr:cytochrome P450 94B3-like [Magnolia sinica]
MVMSIPHLTHISLAFLSLSCFFFILHMLLSRSRRFNWFYSYGPPTYPILGCLIAFYKNRYRLLDWYTDMLAHSPTQTILVQRLGARRTIITANPDNVEYILKTKFDNFPKGEPFTEILGDLLGRGIFNVDGELWHTQRKLASHEFTTKSLREFVISTLEAEVNERLVPILKSAAADQTVVDLQDLLRRFTFDSICKVSLGTDPGCLDPSLPVSNLARSFDMASEISAKRATSPVFAVWKAKRALRVGSEKKLKDAIKLVHGEVMEIIHCKKLKNNELDETSSVNGDLLSRLISGGHDEEVIRDMVISFIMAGRDTTSAALTWLFWLLARHPDIKKEVIDEVSTPLESDEVRLDYENLKEMKLVKACLCESMRLYPPVAWDSKHARHHDTLPDGTRVNKGDRVTYFPYGMGRMETVWGKDQLEFNPRRWLGSTVHITSYKFPVFQGGPRICLGKEMAFIQMEYVVAAMLRRFEFQPVRQDPPVYVPLLTAHMDGGLKVMVKERGGKSVGS